MFSDLKMTPSLRNSGGQPLWAVRRRWGEEGGKTRSRSRERMPTELSRLEWEEALGNNGEVRSLGP